MSVARKAVLSSLVGQPLNVVLLLVGTIATTRLLSPDERGVFSGVMAAFTLVQMIQTFGGGVQATRQNITKSEIRQSATVICFACALAFIALQLFAPAISNLLNEPKAESVIRILSISSLFAPLEVLLGGQLVREMRGKDVMTCSLLKTFMMVLGSISAIFLGYTFQGMAIGFVCATITYCFASYLFVRKNQHWSGFESPSKAYLLRSASLTGFLVAKNASERLIHPAVLALQGAFAAGILGTGWGILDMAKQVLVDSLTMFITPILSGVESDSKTYRFYFEKMTAIIGAIVPPAFLSAGMLSNELIELMFGTKWLSAAPIMTIFSIAGALHYSTIGYAEQLISQKDDGQALKWEIIMGSICLGLFIPALSFSLTTAAWTRVFYSFLVLCLSLYIANRTARIDLKIIAVIYLKNIAISFATILPIFLISYSELSLYPKFAFSVLAGIAFYLAAIKLTKHALNEELGKLKTAILRKVNVGSNSPSDQRLSQTLETFTQKIKANLREVESNQNSPALSIKFTFGKELFEPDLKQCQIKVLINELASISNNGELQAYFDFKFPTGESGIYGPISIRLSEGSKQSELSTLAKAISFHSCVLLKQYATWENPRPVSREYLIPLAECVYKIRSSPVRFSSRVTLRLKRLLKGQKGYKQWQIGLANSVSPTTASLQQTLKKVSWIKCEKDRSQADPMLVEHKDQLYIFFEEMLHSSNVGYIKVGRVVLDDSPRMTDVKSVCFNPPLNNHVSFPHVLKRGADYFLLPENSATANTQIYKATNFPTQWTLYRALLDELPGVDPILFNHNGLEWLFVADGTLGNVDNNLRLFYASCVDEKFEEHPSSPIALGLGGSRMAGPIIVKDSKVFRLGQSSIVDYGAGILVFEITELTITRYQEKLVNDWAIHTNDANMLGFHTYSNSEAFDCAAVDMRVSI
jgi:O-antigen/teichoic acid export membrane protein